MRNIDAQDQSVLYVPSRLLVYGTLHGIIDAICAAVFFSIVHRRIVGEEQLFGLLVIYITLAFGLQAPFGLAVDYFHVPRLAILLGCVFTGCSAIIFVSLPALAIIFAGIGNALYHTGGGSICLCLTPNRAMAPGIFVAPGALGLFIGIFIGEMGLFVAWPFILVLVVLGYFAIAMKDRPLQNARPVKLKFSNYDFELVLILVWISIVIRSLVGLVLNYGWNSKTYLLIAFTLSLALGKALGGFLADKFGWIRIAIGSLLLSAPLLVLGGDVPFMAILGIFLFSMTMPVTLTAISNLLPGRPAFAFGLASLALLMGALPSYTGMKITFGHRWIIFLAVLISAAALYKGLRLYFNAVVDKMRAD